VRFTSCKLRFVNLAFELRSHLKPHTKNLYELRCCAGSSHKFMAEAVRFTSCKLRFVNLAFELRSHLKPHTKNLYELRCCAGSSHKFMAEAVRFELTEDLHPRQFSRLLP